MYNTSAAVYSQPPPTSAGTSNLTAARSVTIVPPPAPSSTASSTAGISKPKKLRRISRACDFCHRRSIRCKPSGEDGNRCQNCVDFDVECTFHRPAKKRGIKSAHQQVQQQPTDEDSSSGEHQHANLLLELTNGHPRPLSVPAPASSAGFKFPLGLEHVSMVMQYQDKIGHLVEVYFEVVYPIFPLFHRQTLLHKVQAREYLRDQALFAAVMSMCALASARARDGALLNRNWPPAYFLHPLPETFFAAARDATPQDLSAMREFDWMRSCALLALFGIQVGKIEYMHQYLGQYHSLVAMGQLHDEKNWPKDVGIVETEERRRLFWSMYTLEVYSSIVWGGIIRCREAQSRVFYPREVDDDHFSDRGFISSDGHTQLGESPTTHNRRLSISSNNTLTDPNCWLHGWNFTTELYRILEHAMDDFHRRRPQNIGPFSPSNLFFKEVPSQSAILAQVRIMRDELPLRFRETRSVVADMAENRYSFQAANITATLQLVQMVLFTAEEASVDEKCAIAQELLDGFAKVPVFFLRAISSPLLHHLTGIGLILGSVIEGPLSESAYLQVRGVLLAMADLLASLEVGMTRNVGATQRLRDHIGRIDEYMAQQRQQESMYYQPHPNGNAQQPHGQPPMPSDPSIDPSLQGQRGDDPSSQQPHGLPSDQWQPSHGQGQPQPQDGGVPQFGYLPSNGVGDPLGGVNGAVSLAPDGGFQFQLPPELLEGWPWPFDISQGFGTF